MSDTQSLPRPGLRPLRKRPSLPRQLWADLPILVLAAILSGYIWYTNRQEILVEGENALVKNVSVKIRNLPANIRVTPATLDPIDLQFKPMTKGQFDRIKRELTENGLTLILGRSTLDARGFSKALGDRYEFDWGGLLEQADRWPWFPEGQISLRKEFEVGIDRPVLPDLSDEGIEVEYIGTTPNAQRFWGAATVFRPGDEESIYVDRIEREELLAFVNQPTLEEAIKLPCSFQTWRRGGDPTQPVDLDAPVRPERKDIVLARTFVELRLRRAGEKALTNELRFAVTQGEADAYHFDVQDKVATDVGPGNANVTATVVGTAAEIARLEETMDQWFFLISILPDERAKLSQIGENQQANVRVRLSIQLSDELRRALPKVRVEPTPQQSDASFILSVSKR